MEYKDAEYKLMEIGISYRIGATAGKPVTALDFYSYWLAGGSEYDAVTFLEAVNSGQRVFEGNGNTIEIELIYTVWALED